uniref:Uncharacterized protein n=1 Tax=Timema tahoe TaxID=61484 RepID=A0A7R9FL16_9NEOP|nr:unnamed protein product [Timema tahoe]
MVVLMGKMEYATDILKALLLRLIDKSVGARHPQVMLRRTESVVEKMLTNWMALCMYNYLKDYAGSSLFLLFKAIKHQIEKGPVDAVTHDARYSLSEERLLREQIEHGMVQFIESYIVLYLECYTSISQTIVVVDTHPHAFLGKDDQPITHYEDDEDEVFLGFDNTVEAYAPSPDGSGEDGDISSTPVDTAPDIDVRQEIDNTSGRGWPRKVRPEEMTTKNKRKKKEKIPYVVTSKEYYEKKAMKKEPEEELHPKPLDAMSGGTLGDHKGIKHPITRCPITTSMAVLSELSHICKHTQWAFWNTDPCEPTPMTLTSLRPPVFSEVASSAVMLLTIVSAENNKTLHVVQDDLDEKIQCKVLDCDTISQVKSKILDALYKNTPFSMRPSIHEVDLGTGTYFTNSLTPIITVNGDVESGSVMRIYHLVKPMDEHHYQTNKVSERTHKAIPEIFLTRLLSTKGTIQKFVDDFFNTILTANDDLPPAVKWLFDLLDEAARRHSIVDPEVVHAWKSNSLPLRFWVNFIKNPDFIFDINKTTTVDSCLSVIAQTFMDSCSTAEHRLGKDSPSNKLLFAKDIPHYREMVSHFYYDVQMLPQITDQEMSSAMQQLSVTQLGEFDTIAALKELYIYVTKYNEQVTRGQKKKEDANEVCEKKAFRETMKEMEEADNKKCASERRNMEVIKGGGMVLDAMNNDLHCKKMHLAHKLENVACTLEGEETSTC